MDQIAYALMPFAELGIQIAGAILLALGTVAAKKAADWLKVSADDKVRGHFLEALDRAIAFAEDQARKRLQLALMTHPASDNGAYDATDSIVADAAAYLRGRLPDALAQLKIDGQGLDAVIRARRAQ